MNTQSRIQQFILEDLLSDDRTTLEPDEPLFSSGLIDSLGTLRLITFIEQEFGVEVGDGEVGEENFRTASTIASFVEQKLAAAG